MQKIFSTYRTEYWSVIITSTPVNDESLFEEFTYYHYLSFFLCAIQQQQQQQQQQLLVVSPAGSEYKVW